MADPNQARQTQLANIQQRTGKTLAELHAVVQKSGLQKHGEQVALLKAKLRMGHGDANAIALSWKAMNAPATTSSGDPLAAIYQGSKAALRPLHEALLEKLVKFGAFETAAKKAYLDAKQKTFVSITGQKDLVKAPFAKNLAQAQMFEVVGTGQDGDYLRMRGYIFKAKEGALTYMIRVFEMGDFPKVDPELEAFLDKLDEKAKVKGGK